MDRCRAPVIPGAFVLARTLPDLDPIRFAPDLDPIRFAPDRLGALDRLPGTERLRVSHDGSVQLRLEGVDAPELHYQAHAQKLGDAARAALLRAAGFEAERPAGDGERAGATSVRGAIAARGVDPHGRVIAYAFRERAFCERALRERAAGESALRERAAGESAFRARVFRAGASATLDVASSINAALLRMGLAYPLAYDTQPASERALFASIARGARARSAGVWALDRTAAFTLAGARSIDARGALVFPKLFRRCLSYLADRRAGFRGDLRAWLEREAGADNDVVIARGRLTRLSAWIDAGERAVRTRIDGATMVFVAR
jgi:endonuclease YncB( thermonuclease family)